MDTGTCVYIQVLLTSHVKVAIGVTVTNTSQFSVFSVVGYCLQLNWSVL